MDFGILLSIAIIHWIEILNLQYFKLDLKSTNKSTKSVINSLKKETENFIEKELVELMNTEKSKLFTNLNVNNLSDKIERQLNLKLKVF